MFVAFSPFIGIGLYMISARKHIIFPATVKRRGHYRSEIEKLAALRLKKDQDNGDVSTCVSVSGEVSVN